MSHILQDVEPDGDVQQAQAHHGEAHDGAGGEGHVQALVQALAGGLSGTGVGGGGDAHAHKAGQGGVDTAGQEGEGDEPVVQHPEIGQSQQDDEHHYEHLGDGGVLVTQIGVSALTDGGGDLLHGVVAFGEGQDFLPLQDGEQQSCHRTDKSDPEIIVQNLHSPLLLTSFDSCLR